MQHQVSLFPAVDIEATHAGGSFADWTGDPVDDFEVSFSKHRYSEMLQVDKWAHHY